MMKATVSLSLYAYHMPITSSLYLKETGKFPVKVGMTIRDIASRVREQDTTACFEEPVILFQRQVNITDYQLHDMLPFERMRSNREWFLFDTQDVAGCLNKILDDMVARGIQAPDRAVQELKERERKVAVVMAPVELTVEPTLEELVREEYEPLSVLAITYRYDRRAEEANYKVRSGEMTKEEALVFCDKVSVIKQIVTEKLKAMKGSNPSLIKTIYAPALVNNLAGLPPRNEKKTRRKKR